MVARSEGHRERVIMAEWTRIDACEDRCPEDHCLLGSLFARIAEGTTVAAASVSVREDTERVRVPACCHTWKRVGKTIGLCVVVLCVDIHMVHGCCKMTGLPFLR